MHGLYWIWHTLLTSLFGIQGNNMENNGLADSIKLVKTSGDELLEVFKWLKFHLPHSWKMCCMLRECLEGRWTGQTWWVLRGPDAILAVGEGLPDENCTIINYNTKPRSTCYFAPDPVHAEMLLTWPGFIDWSEPCIFEMLTNENTAVVDKIAKANNSAESFPRVLRGKMIVANPGDIELRPVPPDLTLRSLDPETDTDLVNDTWKYSRHYADEFVRAMLACFPSVGLFDKNNRCMGLEIGLQDETMGLLYVFPEARGRGLAKVIISQLAHKYFAMGLPAGAFVMVTNDLSWKLHQNLGFKAVCELNFVLHVPQEKFTGYLYGF